MASALRSAFRSWCRLCGGLSPGGLSGVLPGERAQGTVEVVDPVVQLALEPLGQAVPVLGSGDVTFGQLGQRDADLGDGQAHPLAGADHGDAAQDIAVVAALVAGGAVAADQSLPFVEPQRGRGDTAALGDLAHR